MIAIAMLSAVPQGWYGRCASGDWEDAYTLAIGAATTDSSWSDAWAAAAFSGLRAGSIADWQAESWAGMAVRGDSSSAVAWAAMGAALAATDPVGSGEAFRRAITADSALVLAWEGLGSLFEGTGSFDLAIENHRRALDLDRGFVPAALGAARSLEALGRIDEAVAVLEEAGSGMLPNVTLMLEIGRLQEISGFIDTATATYDSVLRVDSVNVEALTRLGLLYESTGRYGWAIKYYRRLVAADPAFSWAYGELALSMELAGLTDSARVWYQKGLEVDPGYAWAALRLGLMARDGGDYVMAAQWLDTAIALDSTMQEAWVDRGLLEEDYGSLEAAAYYYRRAVELDPLDTWTWGELGYVLASSGHPDEAAVAYETAVSTDSNYQWGWEQRGLLFEDAGLTREAIEWYRLAARTTEPSSWMLGELGLLLEQEGETDSAVAAYGRAISLDSAYAFGTLRLARLLERTGRIEEAIPLLLIYSGLEGDTSAVLAEVSILSRRLGREAEADSFRAEALALDPDAFISLGWSYYYTSDDDGVIEALTTASGLADSALALISIGDLYAAIEEYDMAGEAYRSAAALEPGNPSVYVAWGLMHSGNDDYDEAEPLFRKAVELDPGSADALGYLGEALLFQDRYDEAVECLQEVLAIEPASVFAICYLGLVEERRGEPDAALDRYLEALRLEPGYEYAEDRIRGITDPDYDPTWWREDSHDLTASIWADLSIEAGNSDERSYSGGLDAAWEYGPRDSRVSAEFRGTLRERLDKEIENSAWASVSTDYFFTDAIYAKASSSWDRQPQTVRPWQVSSYTSVGYREWIRDWLWVSPEIGAGLVRSQWYPAVKRTDNWTIFFSCGIWLEKSESILPSLWISSNLYLPPDDTEDVYAWGNAELTFDAWERLSVSFGYTLDFTNRPVIPTWEKVDSELYTRLNLFLF